MNSRTSRPRSPISASTVTGASVPRVIIESSVDFPTPEPAKIPMRWPRPHGIKVSIARTPSGSCVSIMLRVRGCGALCSTDACSTWCSGGPPSIGRPRPSITRPRSSTPTGIARAPSDACARSPARTPRRSPSGMHTSSSPRTATTSATTGPASVSTSTDAPIGRCNPAISRFSPSTRTTRPAMCGCAASSTASRSSVTGDRSPVWRPGRARRARGRARH